MLSPDSRAVAFELIRAPDDYRLDFALLTTYTLDLEALLVLPLSILAQPDEGIDKLLMDPLRLHQALRDAGDRVHVFVDEAGIAIPGTARALYAMLEPSVHAVRAPKGGAFHPKIWVARFTATDVAAADRPPILRVSILSRNLTFDCSWDVALASEGSPRGKRRSGASRPLGDFLSALPRLTTTPLEDRVKTRVQSLSEEVARTQFPAPVGFEDPIAFHALGLSSRRRPWSPPTSGYRTLAIAPFVRRTGLDAVSGLATQRMLVSRPEELDNLPKEALVGWGEVLVLSDVAQGEPEDDLGDQPDQGGGRGASPSGLHAKIVAVEHGWDVTWYVGSANLTAAAFGGSNVEMMASMTGRKSRQGIDRFLDGDGGFRKLCVPYQRSEPNPEATEVVEARKRIEEARDRLVQAVLGLTCEQDGDNWVLTLDGQLAIPADVDAVAWPISVDETESRELDLPLAWTLPIARLTAFIAFRLRVSAREVDDLRLTLRVPVAGMPADRIHQVLRTLIDSPEKFLRFLRALLGGLDGMMDLTRGGGDGGSEWGAGLSAETLLEDLMRAASRDPERLKPVRRLIDDLRKTADGRKIVPEDLLSVWNAVADALGEEPSHDPA